MKEKCPVFKVECKYISSCYTIRPERCIESFEKEGKPIPEELKEEKPVNAYNYGILGDLNHIMNVTEDN